MEKSKSKEVSEEEIMPRRGELDLRRITIIALAVFITFCCCTLFFFVLYRYNGFTDSWKNLSRVLQPVTIGIVLAYLLNPIVRFAERNIGPFLKKRIKSQKRAAALSRIIGIAAGLLFLAGIIVLLVAAIVPTLVESVTSMVKALPEEVNSLIAWIKGFAEGDSQFAKIAEEAIKRISEYFETWMTDTVLPQAEAHITSITSGVITGVKFVLNILIGLIISIYLLASKEKFAGQAKKILYAMFKPVRANVIIDTVRKSNEIFGGFITGKILDSAIIGVISYIVLIIMRMPDPMLVAVIIGVTNIIPFFGPLIGAVPSFAIIVLQSPVQGLYFLIFILILQQVDGNIIGPKILSNSTGLSSFWVIFAITVFGGLWGFIGMLLGVPLMAVIYYIIQSTVYYLLKKRGIVGSKIDFVKLDRISKETNQPEYREESEVTAEMAEEQNKK